MFMTCFGTTFKCIISEISLLKKLKYMHAAGNILHNIYSIIEM